jgi:hypothetical protein
MPVLLVRKHKRIRSPSILKVRPPPRAFDEFSVNLDGFAAHLDNFPGTDKFKLGLFLTIWANIFHDVLHWLLKHLYLCGYSSGNLAIWNDIHFAICFSPACATFNLAAIGSNYLSIDKFYQQQLSMKAEIFFNFFLLQIRVNRVCIPAQGMLSLRISRARSRLT